MLCTPALGAANQTQVPASVHNLPASIGVGATVNSNLIVLSGYTKIAIGLTSSQTGLVTIQRFLDMQGTVAIGAPVTLALVAGVPNSLTINDGQIFSSFQVTIQNQGASVAMISNLAIVVAVDPATADGASNGSYTTPTSTAVAVQTVSTPLLTQNDDAKYRAFRNLKTNTDVVWLALGINAVAGQGFLDLWPGDFYEMSVTDGNLYQGPITAISPDGIQTVLVTEGV